MREKISSCAVMLLLAALTAGCSHAPSVPIDGSFFPVWMLCLIAGVVVAFVVHATLVRKQLEEEVGPLWLFYPATVILTASILWLIFYR